ncbi:mannose-6-phosphate isomerase, class I [Conservatibacter flavescens]|uniref:mannose-6-phosphate isomerase n=1 Tax=Conservatibacter flavescens TaxID=28161 RepID=A0A2M8S279_9PAST|nr:mannose-6-phosphate isomerase, class I [Conservatibacter flavescens]PJG85253.1 mannose-6-phosphate isomerase, class I [Conservatibacter flavescens]
MSKIYPLQGTLQHYVWGGADYIPHLLHIEKNQPYYAELWLGAHQSSPSILNNHQPLTEFLTQNPTVLGEKSRQVFGDTLPYLLKILDVKQPLSIQLHPTKQQAEIGFDQENSKGIPLTAPTRTYKDNNHKPEMMIALSDFWLLHGFQLKHKIIDTLNGRPSLKKLATQLENQNLSDFYAHVMQANQAQLAEYLLPIIHGNKAQHLSLDNPDYWVCYTMEAMNISEDKLDAGLICFYLFNIVHLKPGEGIFQDAGIPHAYLRGQNIELMACSDNVIRGGLTPKHVDIPELLKVINCTEIEPSIIAPAPKDQAYTYPTPAKDFALKNLPFAPAHIHQSAAKNAEILLIMEGEAKISTNHTALLLKQGESIFIEAETQYHIEGMQTGYAVVATLP